MLKILALLPKPVTKRLIQGIGLVRNPFTLGVRVIVEDGEGRVLLVRHSYLPGWYLPGGGVDKAETMAEAACREVLEEAGIHHEEPPQLIGIFLNEEATGRDHVGLFHLKSWRKGERFLSPNAEIVEAAFFALDRLPETVSSASMRRLAEFAAGNRDGGDRW